MAKRDRREAIMRAAEKLFTGPRFHETTLDHVVEEAGVGKGTVYRYFENKDDLFFQTATRGFDEMCELLVRKVPEEAPFADRLLSACVEISAFFKRRRKLFRMMQSEEARMHWRRPEIRERWLARRRRLVSAVAGILRQGVRGGKVRHDVRPDILAAFLLGMLRARARDMTDVPERERSLKRVVDLFLAGAGRCG
jgi:AcrR family transcriptional regulator